MAWLWMTLGGLIALLGVCSLARSLLGDRAHGMARCKKCWYDLQGITSRQCPECGWVARKERQIHRTRRRWRRAMLAMCLVVMGVGVALWPGLREKHWSTYVPMQVLYWAATSEEELDFAVSNSTKGAPTRWNWAQEAFAINEELLQDLESGVLDVHAFDLNAQWWNVIELRLATGGSWPAREFHSETLCKAIEHPTLNPVLREMFLRWLRSIGVGSAREGRVARAWLEDDWVGTAAAGTLLYLRRYEDGAVDRLQQDLDNPSPMHRLRVMEAIVERGDQVQGSRIPSAQVVGLLETALGDENEVVRFGASHASAAIVRQIHARSWPRKDLPRRVRTMLVELSRILEEARDNESSTRVRRYLNSTAGVCRAMNKRLAE